MDGKKLIKGKGGLRMVTVNSDFKSAFETNEPPWDEDSKFQFCSKCMKQFTFTTRKHHCRRCGKIYCSGCCHAKIALPRLCFVDPERVCQNCVPIANAENQFFTKHLKVLLNGAPFLLQDEEYVQCYLNPTSKQELLFTSIDGDKRTIEEPVILSDILAAEHITDTIKGSEKLVGIILKMKENGEKKTVKIAIKHGSPNIEKSYSFLDALQQAVKLIFDAN